MKTKNMTKIFLMGLVLLNTNPVFAAEELSGKISVDGSSTVFPITEAVAEEFQKTNSKVHVTVGVSGTGGGFKKFCLGEIDISNASRPISQGEVNFAKQNKIDYIELPVAFDGIAIVVNPKNTFVDHITVGELKKIWETGSTVKMWSDIRATWPKQPIKLYGPGTDSGTFDYFTEAVIGKKGGSRSDYMASEDDNTLVKGVAGDVNALGYFGFTYYEENANLLKAVPVQGGGKPIVPSAVAISNGTYQPLSRPVFIYVSQKSATRPEVKSFVEYYLSNAGMLSKDVGAVALPDSIYQLTMKRFANRSLGSVFLGKNTVGVNLETLLK